MCVDHVKGMVCWKCSDQVPWWRAFRGGVPPYCDCNKPVRWSRKYDACVVCGGTEAAHVGKGVCKTCINYKQICADCGEPSTGERCMACSLERKRKLARAARRMPLGERFGVAAALSAAIDRLAAAKTNDKLVESRR